MATIATLIVDVAANVAKLQTDVGKIHTQLDSVGAIGKSVGNTLTQAFTVTAVVAAGQKLVDFTSRISDLSAKTGMTYRELQRLEVGAGSAGVSVEQIANSVVKLQNRLAEGDRSAVAGLQKLNINLEEFKQLSPGQQFELLAEKIGAVADKNERAHLGLALLDKNVLPSLNKHTKETADIAEQLGLILGDDVVEGGDAAGDALQLLGLVANKVVAEALKPTLKLFTEMPRETEAFRQKLEVLRGTFQHPEIQSPKFLKTMVEMPPILREGSKELNAIYDELDRGLETQRKAADAAERHAESIRQLRDQLSGADLARQVRDLDEATAALTRSQREQPDVMDRVSLAARQLYDDGARLTPELFRMMVNTQQLTPEVVELSQAMIQQLGPALKLSYDSGVPFIGVLNGIRGSVGQVIDIVVPATEKTVQWHEAIDGLSQSFANLAQVAGGSFSSIARGLASVISLTDATYQSVKQARAGFKEMGSEDGSKFGGLMKGLAGVMGVVSAIVQGIQMAIGLVNHFRGGEEGIQVNPARDAFIGQFGPGGTGAGSGFQNLAGILSEITGEGGGGSLFKALAQADTMAEFNAAVAAIEDALRGAGRMHSGEDYVMARPTMGLLPDEVPAILRSGEAVLNPRDAADYRSGGRGGSVVINIDARESFFDTPASLDKLARKVGDAVMQEQRRTRRLNVA